ncbi:putative reverse transcriptase zinc-binding domain-containing protein [Helianthus annuus]|nr:putative reverse transcriptase zinc-binding domain-containing protein [Helianthus annuus]
MVSDRLRAPGPVDRIEWQWHRAPSSNAELTELNGIVAILAQISITNQEDSWTWQAEDLGIFTVKSVRKIISNTNTVPCDIIFEWNRWIPRKVNIFGWRMNLDRLPTRCALEKRHIPIPSTLCPLCSEANETVEHLFTSCFVCSIVWQMVSSWLSIPPIYAYTVRDILGLHKDMAGLDAKKMIIHAILVIACWGIWKLRNEVVFSSKRIDIARLIADIKASSYLWVKNIAKLFSVEWVNWLEFDFV